MKLSSKLYSIAKQFGKSASIVNDIETLLTGDKDKMTKRVKRKVAYKAERKLMNFINRKIK